MLPYNSQVWFTQIGQINMIPDAYRGAHFICPADQNINLSGPEALPDVWQRYEVPAGDMYPVYAHVVPQPRPQLYDAIRIDKRRLKPK